MVSHMGQGSVSGLMEICMRDSLEMAFSVGKEFSNVEMVVGFMMVNGLEVK